MNNLSKGGFALSVIFWIAVWFVAARLVGNELLFAGPDATAAAFAEIVGKQDFWINIANTTARVLGAGCLAAVAGVILGALAYKFTGVRTLLAPLLQVVKSAPVACIVVIILVAWGSIGALLAIVAFVVFPQFYVATMAALEERPRLTEQVLALEGARPLQVALLCTWPAMAPRFITGAKVAVAMAWRAAITAELLSLPLHSIGSGVYSAKLTLNSGELLVWTFVVMVLSWLTEKIVVGAFKLSVNLQKLTLASADRAFRSEPEALELTRVSKSFGGSSVLEDFSLSIAPGQRLCLMAPTGSGKTTSLGIILGLIQPDAGKRSAPETIGVMLQTPQLVENLTALQNVMAVASPDYTESEIILGLEELLPEATVMRPAAKLSGGTRRLVELARALYSPGGAIVLDEPFAGLDKEARRRACSFILEHLRNRPLLVTTHNSEDAQLLDCDVLRLGTA